MKIERFEHIIACQKAKELTLIIYSEFENSKGFGFRNQIRRASISVMTNIAEGFKRRSNKEFRQFIYIAKGSCGEVSSMLHLSKEFKNISEKSIRRCLNLSEDNFKNSLWIN